MSANKDVLQLLKADHDKVRKLLKELENAPSNKAKAVLKKLKQEIEMHTSVEEKIVYPAYRESVGSDEAKVMVEESRAEHMLADILLKQLGDLRAGTPEFKGKAAVFKENVEHHAEEEEKDMFPQMRKNLHKEDLIDLGRQMQEFKRGGMEVRERKGTRTVKTGRRSTTPTAQSGRSSATSGKTRQELYQEATRKNIEGRSSMSKQELEKALRSR